MANLILPSRFRTQPIGPAKVDTSLGITKGLLTAVLPARRVDSLLGLPYTQDGTYVANPSAAGLGLSTDGSASSIWLPIKSVALTRFTIFGVFKSNSNGTDARALALGSSSDNNPIVQIGSGTSNATKVRIFARTDGGVTPSDTSTTLAAFDGKEHTVAVTYNGSVVSVYIDGVFDSSSALSSGTFTVDRFCVGALRRSSTAVFWAGTTFFGATWDRVLGLGEIASLDRNPWQIFVSPAFNLQTSSGLDSTVTANQAISASANAAISMAVTATANQATSAAATATISTDATSASNQVISTASTATISTDATATTNQVISTAAATTISIDASVTTSQVTSTSSTAGVSIDASAAANQVVSTSSAAAISMDTTVTAGQVTSTTASSIGAMDVTSSAGQVTSAAATATISTDAPTTTGQVISATSAATVSMAVTVTGYQAISAVSSITVSMDTTVTAGQVTSTSSTTVIVGPLDSTVTVNQVTSVRAIARIGAEAPSPWQRLVVRKPQQALAKPEEDQLIVTI